MTTNQPSNQSGNEPVRIRLSTPTDILDVVPVTMGFYPTESLCVLYMETTGAGGGGGSRLALTARNDLPTTDAELTTLVNHTAELLSRYPSAILAAYSADQEEARQVVAALMIAVAERFGSDRIITGVIASPQGWTTVDSQYPTAIQWTNPYPAGPGQAAAEAAAAGLYAMGTRDDLRDSIASPDTGTVADYQTAATEQAIPDQPTEAQLEAMAGEVREVVSNYIAQPYTITADDAAFLATRVRFGVPRDAALTEIQRRDAQLHTTLWQGIAAMTPDQDAAPVLGLLAIAAWAAGQGALTNIALERASNAGHPTGHGLLGIAATLIERAIPPTSWEKFREGLL